jgi:cell division protein FtsL
MNMIERVQDQRPVYMGTFSKYTRAFEARMALIENDVEYHKRTLRTQTKRIEKLEKTMKYTIIAGSVIVLAMIMLTIFS